VCRITYRLALSKFRFAKNNGGRLTAKPSHPQDNSTKILVHRTWPLRWTKKGRSAETLKNGKSRMEPSEKSKTKSQAAGQGAPEQAMYLKRRNLKG
jgi:hypothetical protein